MMDMNVEKVASSIDMDGPIDFEEIKREVEAHGPLQIYQPYNPYKVNLEFTRCACSNEGCTAELVIVTRTNGLLTTRWILSREEFESFGSLSELKSCFFLGEFFDSRSERLMIEREVFKNIGKKYWEAESIDCACSNCVNEVGEEKFANMVQLSNLANLLKARDELIYDAEQWDLENAEDDDSAEFDVEEVDEVGKLRDWVFDAIELGYSLGRSFSEYSVKNEIEPLALIGLKAIDTKKKREAASGDKSRELREKRRSDLLDKIEALASRSPDIVRFGQEKLAGLAAEDCVTDNPNLWKQGKGQVNDYLGEIRRGEAGDDMKARFQALFGSKPLKGFQ